MCELYGFSSKRAKLINDSLREFYSHSDKHPHGWGLAYTAGGQICIDKEPLKASESSRLRERLSYPVCTDLALAHIRYATIGNVYRKNCHPYSVRDNCHRRWTLIHNGTIFDFPPLRNYINCQYGDTDSERVLLYIIDMINKEQSRLCRPLSFSERFSVIDKAVINLSPDNKLNLIIYDGDYMYIHTNYRNSLYYLQCDESMTVSTQPLSDNNWQNVPFTTLVAVKDGRFAAMGTKHSGEYIENEENIQNLYRIFSEL